MEFLFQAGGALPTNHPAYIARRSIDDAAYQAMVYNYMLHVIAPRQVGKTSLLYRLKARLLSEGWRCAFIDLSVLKGLAAQDWYTALSRDLSSQITPSSRQTFKNQVGMRHYLIEQLLPRTQPKIAVFFDEIESVLLGNNKDAETFSDAFFMTIRNLYNQRDTYAGTLAVAFAGSISSANLVKDPAISPFNIGQTVTPEDFSQDETRTLTQQLSKLGKAVEEHVHQTIYEWTSGHPYLTHRICFELEQDGSTDITVTDVERTIRHVFLQLANPLAQDSNLRHVIKMVRGLPEPVRGLWQRIQNGERITLMNVDAISFQDLYITGALKAQDDRIIVRNRIYEEILLRGREKKGEMAHRHATINMYYCYDNTDRRLKDELAKHLALLHHSGRITSWDSWEIRAGAEWEREIENHLNAADIILLLISPDFVKSERCQKEMRQALDRCSIERVDIIPVLLRPVRWEGLPISRLQALPKDGKPITLQNNRDAAFQGVAKEIESVIASILS